MARRARTDKAKDQRRLACIDAALDEFFAQGYSAARMDDIARRAGFSKGTLYLYFESKQALFEAVVQHVVIPTIEHCEAMAEEAGTFAELMDALTDFAPPMLRESNMPKLMKVLVGDSHTFPEVLQDYRRNVVERVIRALQGLLERSMVRGEIPELPPELLARLIMAPVAFSGLWQAMYGRDPDSAVDLEGLFKLHADLMKKALCREQEP